MSRVRALFLGTPEIARTCLAAMLDDEHFEVVGVVSQPDRPAGRRMKLQPSAVKALAVERGLPVITPERASDTEVLDQIKAFGAEVAVVVAFGQILKQSFLDLFPQRVVNVHASLLPRWRGAAPMQRSLMAGDAETGVCLQVMVRKLDAGPLLGHRVIPLTPEMNAVELYQRCETLGAQLLSVDLMDYLRGNLSATPQDESRVTIAPKIDKAECQIDWSWPAERIHNLVRGLAMGPFAYTKRGGKMIKLHQTRVAADATSPGRPGEVANVTDKSVLVRCGDGGLELLIVQPESRAQMPIAEYLRGYPLKIGDAFGPESLPDRP